MEIDWTKIVGLGIEYGLDLLFGLIVLVVGLKVVSGIAGLVSKVCDKKGMDATLKPFFVSSLSILLKTLVVITALQAFGVQMAAFITVLGAAGLAVGMAFSGNLQNFAGGVLVLIFRPLQVGEFVEAQGHMGTVKEISVFHTTLLTPDNKTIIIPNGPLSNGSLVNFSRQEKRRVDLVFGIGYSDDSDKAIRVIKDVIASHDKVLNEPAEPFVKMSELADSSVNFAVRIWVNAPDFWDVHFYMIENVKKAFDREGISIPFPQRDVHVIKE